MFSVVFFLILDAIIFMAALPLGLRLIPPNPVYGLNTSRTRDDAALWYNVNAVAGQLIAAACLISALLIMTWQGTWFRSFWAQFFVFVIPLAAAVGATLYFERKGGWK